jgi:hypothetical protein
MAWEVDPLTNRWTDLEEKMDWPEGVNGLTAPPRGASNQVMKDLQEAVFMIDNQTNRWLDETMD